jgi:DNA-binding NarL/FixJ family response regulator
MNKIKILLVDDHAALRESIRALVEVQKDIEIVGEASEGREALELAKKLKPDVVIMDIAMPEMDGIEATRRMVKEKSTAKVLILSQHLDREFILLTLKAGAAGYLPKIALGSELISAIRTIYQGDSYLHRTATSALIEDYRKNIEADPYDRLTTREREVLQLIVGGHTSRQIANMLVISLKTVHGHRNKILQKLDISNRTKLIKYSIRKGLININA